MTDDERQKLTEMIEHWRAVKIAIENWSRITEIVRQCETENAAVTALRSEFQISDASAETILLAPVRRLIPRHLASANEQLDEYERRLNDLE